MHGQNQCHKCALVVRVQTARELAIPTQKKCMPTRQQKKSQICGIFLSQRWLKVIASQMMAPASQQILPPMEELVLGRLAVGGEVEGQRGLQAPQSRVGVKAKRQLKKLLETTSLPTPTTGRQLSPQPRQQAIPHPGRAGGLATTLSQRRMMQLTKTLRKMKYPIRQQNSTSVQPTMSIMPAPQPIRKQWIDEKRPFTLGSTLLPKQRVRAQMRRSKAGQRQITRNTVLTLERLLEQKLQRVGRSRVYMTYRPARMNRGMVLENVSLFRSRPLLLISATMMVRTTNIAQQIQSLQKLRAYIVSTISTPSNISTSAMKVTYFIALFYWRSMRFRAQTRIGPFQSTQEYTSAIAVPVVSKGSTVVKILVELAQVVVSMQALTVLVLQQQYEACLPTAKQSMAQMPMFTAIAMRKATQWTMYPVMEGSFYFTYSVGWEGWGSCLDYLYSEYLGGGSLGEESLGLASLGREYDRIYTQRGRAQGSLELRQPFGWIVSPRLPYI